MKTELYNKLVEISSIKTAKIKPDNLKVGVNAYNVIGNFTENANATSSDIEINTSGYVNAVKIEGILPVHTNESIGLLPIGSATANDISNNMEMVFHTNTVVNIDNSSIGINDIILKNSAVLSVPYDVMAKALNINPLHIRKDVSVLGVVGNYDASTEFSGVKLEPIEFSTTQVPLLNLITEISNLDMTLGTNLYGYFSALPKLIYVSNISMPNILSGSYMFGKDTSLQYISNIDMYNDTTINSINLSSMFFGCTNLTSIENSCRFPKSIGSCYSMFNMCSNLRYINTFINLEKTNSFLGTFYNCMNLADFSNIGFNYNSDFPVLNFSNCSNINLHTVHNVNWLNCTYRGLLENCTNVSSDDIETCMANGAYITSETFAGTGINRIPNVPYYSNESHVSGLFMFCNNLLDVTLDTDFFNNFPQVNNMVSMFSRCGNLKQLSLNIGNLELFDISNLVKSCYNLSSLNVGGAHIKSISDISSGCYNIVSANVLFDTANWDGNFGDIFNYCYSLENVVLDDYNGNWNIGNTLIDLGYAFNNCQALKSVSHLSDILGRINYFRNAFINCYNLSISSPFVVNVASMNTDYANLFTNCPLVTGDADVYITYNNVSAFQYINIFNNVGVRNVNIHFNGSISSRTTYSSAVGPFVESCRNLVKLNSNFNVTSQKNFSVSLCQHCENLTDINFDLNINTLYGVSMSEFLNNCSNLTNLTINFNSVSELECTFFKIINCPSFSNQSLDNILGFLVNINMVNSSYKTLKNIGLNTYSNTIWETLPNYSNFIGAGYSVGY